MIIEGRANKLALGTDRPTSVAAAWVGTKRREGGWIPGPPASHREELRRLGGRSGERPALKFTPK
jgi:hypothetical protein